MSQTDQFLFDFFLASSSLQDPTTFIDQQDRVTKLLQSRKGHLIQHAVERQHRILVVVTLTGGTESIILDLLASLGGHQKLPVVIAAHSSGNSLPAAMEVLAYLQQQGEEGRLIYLDDLLYSGNLEPLVNWLRILHARTEMLTTTIDLVGAPSPWLVASSPDHDLIREQWGPSVRDIAMEAFDREFVAADGAAHLPLMEGFINGANSITGPDQADFSKSLKAYGALKKLIGNHRNTCVSLRCFDMVTDHQATGCFALSQLNDEGITAGCEGDLISTLTMHWVKLLTGESAWMANPAHIDVEEQQLLLAHCTIGRALTTAYDVLTHYESDLGIGIRGHVASQPCTLVRIGGKRLEKIWIEEGMIIRSEGDAGRCRTQLVIQTHTRASLESLLSHPLGNHLVLIPGHHGRLLHDYHQAFVS